MSKFFMASVLAMLLSPTLSAQAALADDLNIVNVMPAFEKAWQLGLGKPTQTRIKLLK